MTNYISDKTGMPFTTIGFTDKQALVKYTKDRYIDVLLIAFILIEDEIERLNIGKIIILSEGEIPAEYNNYLFVYKYQSVESIIKKVLDYFADISKEYLSLSHIEKSTQIIGIYSPQCGMNYTIFTLILGQILARQYSVLYINMEEFAVFDKIFCKNYARDLADLMYFFKQNPKTLPIKIKMIAESFQDMDYIPPLLFSQDLRNLDTKEWTSLIMEIANASVYEIIVLGISNMVSNIFDLLEMCNTIYMPVSENQYSLMKVSAYEEFLFKTEREDIVNRTIKVQIPELGGGEWNENYLVEQLWGPMGEIVRKAINEAGLDEDRDRDTSGEGN